MHKAGALHETGLAAGTACKHAGLAAVRFDFTRE
jgi:hypothetical protein